MHWLVGILALSVVIILHEFGHFLAAKWGGMHVSRFSVLGIGPVVLRLFTWRGTEFVISAVPFGAYVQIAGMEPEEEGAEGEAEAAEPLPEGCREFRDCSWGARVAAIAGGPLANYAVAMLIMVGLFAWSGLGVPRAVAVSGFGADSPAEAAGLRVGDEFVSVAGVDVRGDRPDRRLIEAAAAHMGETVEVAVQRGGETLRIPVTLNAEPPALATQLNVRKDWVPVGPGKALALGVMWPLEQSAAQLSGLWSALTGESSADLGGPVAIAVMLKQSAERSAADLMVLVALISTVLGLFNLLPLPALDGGRLVFLFWEAVSRRPTSAQLQERVHALGMLALLLLIAYLTVGDVRSLFGAAG